MNILGRFLPPVTQRGSPTVPYLFCALFLPDSQYAAPDYYPSLPSAFVLLSQRVFRTFSGQTNRRRITFYLPHPQHHSAVPYPSSVLRDYGSGSTSRLHLPSVPLYCCYLVLPARRLPLAPFTISSFHSPSPFPLSPVLLSAFGLKARSMPHTDLPVCPAFWFSAITTTHPICITGDIT